MDTQRLVIPMRKPKPTYIYLISDENGHYKIGIAQDVAVRLCTLQAATPYTLSVLASIAVKNALQVESFIHSMLEQYHVRGEWFSLPGEQTFHDAVKKYRGEMRKPKRSPASSVEIDPWPDYNDKVQRALLRHEAKTTTLDR